jgi:cytochrome c peroxidase
MPMRILRAKRAVVIGALAVAIAGASLAVTVLIGPLVTREPGSPDAVAFAARGAEKVKAAYADWVIRHNTSGGDRNVAIALGYWKALSAAHTQASGMATLDLIDGSVSVTVSGLPKGEWDVWLVDNRPNPNASLKPDSRDGTIRVGRLLRDKDTSRLEAHLGATAFKKFHVDLVVVAPAGSDPGSSGLLFGSPSLFQRLYTALRSTELLMASDFATQPGIAVERRWASLFGAPTAEADDTGIFVNEDVVFTNMVAKGADLFFNETFKGNGRTCATCHRKEDNFSISPNFIATLDDDDPLFVAEFKPALAFNPFAAKFEIPLLMRKYAHIVENVDGMSDLVNRFTLRGVPHTQGMSTSLTPATGDGTTQPPNQRTGWSGDGAPGTGTLRDFATGAVTQHFPKRLNRVVGVDFRLPTDAELNAMEAFQLSLGRQADLTLPLGLKDPQALRGQQLFLLPANTPGGGGGCNACHANAGANAAFGGGGNRNFNTGIENQLDKQHVLALQSLNIDLTPGIATNISPRDGGFGQAPNEGPDQTGFGNGTFNTVSLVEAADSNPFFHDNSIATIEGAVAFYNSDAFNTSPGAAAGQINLGATQVEAVAAFLRVINALDNIREATECATAARSVANSKPRAAGQLLEQAVKETEDAYGVLFARALHQGAMKSLGEAIKHFERAKRSGGIDRDQINRGLNKLAAARNDIVQ